MLAIARHTVPDLHGWTAPDGPPLITTMDQLAQSARAVAGAEIPPDCPGVIIAAFGDPGRADLAQRLRVPVLGIGQCAAEAAAQGGRRFAVACHTPGLVPGIDALMTGYGGAAYLGCWLTEVGADLDAALLAAVIRAHAAGAEAVIIGGGPLGEVAIRLAPQSPCPLIQPIPEASRRLRDLLISERTPPYQP